MSPILPECADAAIRSSLSEVFFVKKKEKLFLGGEINLSELDADVQKKYEVAKELGIYDKVLEKGWGSLTAEETGRVGGVLRKRKNSGERVLS